MKFFYLLLTIFSYLILVTAPEPELKATVGRLDLCDLRENQTGKVTGIVTAIEFKDRQYTTIVDPRTGCSSLITSKIIPLKLQHGITFNAMVQNNFLRFTERIPEIKSEPNLGTIIPYREITNYISHRPREIGEYNRKVIDLKDENGNRISLYISKSLAKQIKYDASNTFYYDNNSTIRTVINN